MSPSYKDLERMSQKQSSGNEYAAIAMYDRPLCRIANGVMRWLEDNQIVEFESPRSPGLNTEFTIKGRLNQKIWFSQLSSRGISGDLLTPIFDKIIFKGEPECNISDKFATANSFWTAVKGKKFRVQIIARGYSLNKDHALVQELQRPLVTGAVISEVDSDKSVFEYIRNAVDTGKLSSVVGTLKNKIAYRLIEL